MPYPATPSLTLARVSNTSFSAAMNTADAGSTVRLYYQLIGSTAAFIAGPTVVTSGTGTLNSLVNQGQYSAYAVTDNGSSFSQPAFKSISLASTDSLFAAILAKFNSNAPLVAMITGGLWVGEVPENVDPPYCYYDQSLISTAPNFVDELEFGSVSFNVYALGYHNAHQAVRQLKAVFDYSSLTFATFAGSVGIWPLSWRIYNEHIRFRDNEQIHRGTVNYRLAFQKPRAN